MSSELNNSVDHRLQNHNYRAQVPKGVVRAELQKRLTIFRRDKYLRLEFYNLLVDRNSNLKIETNTINIPINATLNGNIGIFKLVKNSTDDYDLLVIKENAAI